LISRVISDGRPTSVLSTPAHQEKRGLGKLKYGEVKFSGVELSISWLVVRLSA
jgi:hypothetical protein